MARFYALLAAAAAFIASSSASVVLEARDADATLPPLTPAGIIDALESIGFIQNMTAFITIETLITNTLDMEINIINPLPVELTLDSLSASAGLNGTVIATFTHSFPSPGFILPALSSANSGTIDNVALPQGALGLLGKVPFGILDLTNISSSLRAITDAGAGGLAVPLAGIIQTNVPTSYALASCVPS